MKLRYYMRGLGIGIIVTAILMSVSLHSKTKPMSDSEVIERAKELGLEEKYDAGVLADGVSENTTEAKAEEKPKTEAKVEEKQGSDAKVEEKLEQDVKAEEKLEPGEKADESTTQMVTEENKQAKDALERAQEAKDKAEESAKEATQKANAKAEDASKLKVESNADTKKEETAVDGKPNKQPEEKKPEKVEEKKADEPKVEETKEEEKAIPNNADTEIVVSGGDGSFEVAKKLEKAGVIADSRAYDTYLCQKGYDRRITTGKHKIKKGATEEEIAKELTTRVTK